MAENGNGNGLLARKWVLGIAGTIITAGIIGSWTHVNNRLNSTNDRIQLVDSARSMNTANLALMNQTLDSLKSDIVYINARNFDTRLTRMETLMETILEEVKSKKKP